MICSACPWYLLRRLVTVDFIQVFPSCCLASIWVWSRQNTGRPLEEGGDERGTGICCPGFAPLGSPAEYILLPWVIIPINSASPSLPLSGFCNHTSSTYFFRCKKLENFAALSATGALPRPHYIL